MNKMIKFPLILALTGTICATALGVVYQVANPIIEERVNAAANAAISSVIPGAKGADITKDYSDKEELFKKYSLTTIYEVESSEGKKLGYGYKLSSPGKMGPIEVLVILDDEKILGIKVLSQKETPNFFQAVIDAKYEEKFTNVTQSDLPKVDKVAGSSVSSNGIKNAVIAATEAHKEIILGQTIGPKEVVSQEELAKLGYTGETIENATEQFKAKQGSNYENVFLVNKLGISDAFYRKNSAGEVIGYVYYFNSTYTYEGSPQNHRCLFSFDKDGSNTKFVVLESTDSLKAYGKQSLIEMTDFINSFNGKTISQIANSQLDKVTGATFTTKTVNSAISIICANHKPF